MKLLHKKTILLIPIYVLIFSMAGIAFYFAAQLVLHEDVEDLLLARKEFLQEHADDIEDFSNYQLYSFGTMQVSKTQLPVTTSDEIKDTVVYDEIEKKHELYSQLTYVVQHQGEHYKIVLRRNIVNTADWLVSIAQVVVVLFFILMLLLFAANVIISRSIWNPFYKTLDKLLAFQVSQPNQIQFPSTTITEFQQLSHVLVNMIQKIQADYISLKKFSENASHEFQTPLAVIKIKLDMLLQSPHLPKEELENVNAALRSVKKLSKLNEALLLLTKLENRQFAQVSALDLNEVIKEKIEHLTELIRLKNLSIHTSIQGSFLVDMNTILGDLLMENLISNAIKHNMEGGEMRISTSHNKIEIKNTGNPISVAPEELFERFSKSNQSSGSLGLGLAIVKEITNTYGLQVIYAYSAGYHTICISK